MNQFSKRHSNLGCPICKREPIKMFNWEIAQMQSYKQYRNYAVALTKKEKLKRGWLYECVFCHEFWYLDDEEKFIYWIKEQKIPLLRRWNKLKLILSPALLNKLKFIYASPVDIYGNGENYIKFPCEVIDNNGNKIDFSYICLQKIPPIEYDVETIRFVDEIKDIHSSKYVLPNEIRIASAKAQEIKMGFTPLVIETSDRRQFFINGQMDFFSTEKYVGRNMKLSTEKLHNFDNLPQIAKLNRKEITYFIGDWDELLKSLRLE